MLLISVSVLGKSEYLRSGLETALLLLLLGLKAQVHFLRGLAGRFGFYRPCSLLNVRGVSPGAKEETHWEAEADNDAEHTEYQSWSWKYFKLSLTLLCGQFLCFTQFI